MSDEKVTIPPMHSGVFRKVGDGPVELVGIYDLSKHREPPVDPDAKPLPFVDYSDALIIVRTDLPLPTKEGAP